MASSVSRVGLCFLALVAPAPAQGGVWRLLAPRTKTISFEEPPASFERRENIEPVGVANLDTGSPARLQTNKFYSNFLIDGPARSAWTLPYIVTVNDEHPFGVYVSFPRFFEGQRSEDDRLKWYATTTTKDIIVSAQELYTNQESVVESYDQHGLSAVLTCCSDDASSGKMTTFLVRGMAYATMLYEDLTPEVSTIHAILRVNGEGAMSTNHTSSDGTFKIELNDGSTWMLYSSNTDIEFYYAPAEPNQPNALKADMMMTGTLRVARVPYKEFNEDGELEQKYEESVDLLNEYAGTYPTGGSVKLWEHRTDDMRGRYRLLWEIAGAGDTLLHYSLPHHQALIATGKRTGIYMSSPTKGDMELLIGNFWTLQERELPEFEWVPGMSAITSDLEKEWIEYYLEREIGTPLNNVAGNSIYFGGKNLMAYAQLCLVAEELERDDLVEFCVDQVEAGFEEYYQHTNGNPLVYDTTWGGVIGAQGLEEDNGGADFYSAFYNDHHFHYSYILNAAAILAHLRPSWVTSDREAWVEVLIRDVSNPNDEDEYFPYFRSFDWFSGHSWARGLLFSYDGKDQESTSEDVNFSYAMTMWGIATGNTRLTGMGRLQTAVLTRSLNEYFLLKDSNINHPADFVRNKVTGVYFESKVDYTTWFGDNVEYIHGIQNIPVTAITPTVRDAEFVSEEWDQRLEDIVEEADGVWATVLYMSYATIQKHLAFEAMLTSGVDDGLLRAWALYWAATRPDCDTYCDHDEALLPEVPAPTPAPVVPTGAFGGIPAIIPGVVEAEEFDYGGEGVAYSDTDAGNNGGAFRTDVDVDISAIGDVGFNVGWLRAGEYMRYTVDVEIDADAYDFSFMIASPPGQAGVFQIVSGGTGCDDYATDLSGEVMVPTTGSWGAFEPFEMSGGGDGGLTAGEAMIWVCVISSGFNLDSFTMTAAA